MNTSVEGLSLVTVIALIRKEIAESRAVGKAGNDGKQGAKGDRGPKGDSGPAGRQGPKGNDGKQGKPGKDGTVGEDGTNGVGIQDIEQDIDGAIVVTMTDGEIYTLELPTGGDTTQVHYKVGGGGGGESGSFEVTTDKVKTRSDIIFRDAKGRYKSTKNIPELKNQLEVNRWFVEQLESIESGEIDLPEMTSEAVGNTIVSRNGNADSSFNKVNAIKGNFGGAEQLRPFSVYGTGHNGRLSLQGGSDNDNPGLEMTTDGNVTRVLQRINRAGTNGTELQVWTQVDGAGIHMPFVFGEGGEFFLRPKGADTGVRNDAGFRNQKGTLEFRNDQGEWTPFDEAGEIDLPEMTTEAEPNTLVLRGDSGGARLDSLNTKNLTLTHGPQSHTEDTWFCSGGQTSTHGIKKNTAEGMRASLNVYSKDEVNALSGGDSFFRDIGDNNIEYFGDQLWVTSLRDPFFIGAKIGSDSEFTGTVTANKFVGDGSGLTGTVSAKALAEAFGDIQAALADEKTVAGLKKALTNSLGGLIERLGEAQ
jgi:hypothetical protein